MGNLLSLLSASESDARQERNEIMSNGDASNVLVLRHVEGLENSVDQLPDECGAYWVNFLSKTHFQYW